MVFMRPLLIASLLALGACDVGEVPVGGGAQVDAGGGGGDGGGGGGGGGQSFTAMIVPLVTECATVACHGGVQPPILTSFDALAAKYKTKPGSSNILVTKGALTGGSHSGLPYFTTAEQATVAAWIDSL